MPEYTKVESSISPEYLSADAADNKELLTKYEINCDMGEGFGPYTIADDEALIPLIDSANIACGFHAGDAKIMEKTIRLCKTHNVKVAAHPGFPDREGFGRRSWAYSPDDVYRMVVYQVGALKGFLDAEGVELTAIKPHGELYFYIAANDDIKEAVIKAAKVFGVPLIGAKSAPYLKIAQANDQKFIQEVYPDLNYGSHGDLVRIKAGPKALKTPQMIYDCIMRAGMTDQLVDIDGNTLDLNFNGSPITFCLHSDMPTAAENAKLARSAIDKLNAHYGLK